MQFAEATMGRFKTWIDRARQSRPGRRRAAGTTARRRSLAFEQYESRIALSAAQPVYEIDVSDLVSRDELLARFDLTSFQRWSDGLAGSRLQWAQGDGGLVIFLPRGRTLSLVGEPAGTEGGLIGFDSSAQLQLSSGMRLSATDGAEAPFAGQVQGMLHDAFQSRAAGATLSDYFLNDFDAGGAINVDKLGQSSNLEIGSSAPSLDLGSLDNLSDGGSASSPAAGLSPPAAAPPPVLRITIPAGLARSEGGVIDLTAMAGPTSLTPRSSHELIAATSPTPSARLAGAVSLVRESLPVESMRARAVVFEVAGSVEEIDAEIEDALRRIRETDRRPIDAHDSAGEQAAVTDADGDRQVPLPNATDGDAGEQTASHEASEESRGEQAPNERDSVHQQRSAASRDEALAVWLDEQDARSGQEGDLALTPTGTQKAGLALAVALGAGPLVKRARRARASATIEQASDPERESEA